MACALLCIPLWAGYASAQETAKPKEAVRPRDAQMGAH